MKVNCNICNCFVELEEHERHFQKCSAINYIQIKSKELYGQEMDKKELIKLNLVELNKIYFKVLNEVYVRTTDIRERKRIENILYGTDYSLKECI